MRIQEIAALAAVLAASLFLGGCATLTKGTTQTVYVDTPGVPGASCTASTAVGPQTTTTPGTFMLAKSSAALPVRCTKECYQDSGGVLGSTFEAMTAGNLIVGGVIGIGVDAMSGAMNKYPDQIQIVMPPIPGCGAPPPGRPLPGPRQRRTPPPVAARPPTPPVAPAVQQIPEPQLSDADRAMMQRQ